MVRWWDGGVVGPVFTCCWRLVCTWLATLCSVEYTMCRCDQLALLLSLLTLRATAYSWRDSGYFNQRQKFSTSTTSAPSFQQYYEEDYYYDYGRSERSQRSHHGATGISLLYFYINTLSPHWHRDTNIGKHLSPVLPCQATVLRPSIHLVVI